MNYALILNEVNRSITNELTTSLKKETLKAISELNLFDTEPQWLKSALNRHGSTPTLSTSDVLILKSLMENKKH